MSNGVTTKAVATPVLVQVKPKIGRDSWIMRGGLAVIGLYLVITVVLPLWTVFQKSFQDVNGNWIGLANFQAYFADPALA